MSEPSGTKQQSILDDNRMVSVIFADVCGFTRLTEQLDPEVISEVLNGCYQGLAQEVERFGGVVDKYIGDCMMARFGAPYGHGNDAERAVQAALAMQEFMESYGQQAESVTGTPLRIRVGVATGKVFAGWIGHEGAQSYTVIGDAVNVAQRLEGEAEPGSVVIADGTYRHVRGLFPCSAVGHLRVRGREQPVPAFIVKGRRPRFAVRIGSRHLYGAEVAFIGRDEELESLKASWDRCRESGVSQAVTVLASEGLGKSRLVHELLKLMTLEGERQVVGIGACSHHGRTPLEVFEEIILGLSGCYRHESAETIQSELTRLSEIAIPDPQRAQEVSRELAGLLGLEDETHGPAISRQTTFQAIADLLSGLARRQPVMLVLEDLHWAAPQTRALIRYLNDRLREYPVFFFGCARPGFLDREPNWGQGLRNHQLLELSSLGGDSRQQLVAHLLRYLTPADPELVVRIAEQSDGNPFYAEEIVRDLVDRGLIDVSDPGRWLLADAAANLEVPATVEGVLQARLDRLSARAREVLQQGAVVGRRFTRSTLVALGAVEGQSLSDALAELEQKELVFSRNDANSPGDQAFIFKQSLVRDVAYENLLKRQRSRYHRALAQWLDQRRRKEDARSDDALIGHHYELGGCPEQAVQAYLRGADFGEQAFALEESQRAYACARRVLAGSPDLGWELRLPGTDIYAALAVEMGEARGFLQSGDFGEAASACDSADSLMRKRASVFGSARNLLTRGALALETSGEGATDEAVADFAVCARDTALAAGDGVTELSARMLLVEDSMARGDLDAGLRELPSIDRLMGAQVARPVQRMRLSELRAKLLQKTGDLGAAEQILREALEHWEEGLRDMEQRYRLLDRLAGIMEKRGEASDAAFLRKEAAALERS